MAEAGKTVTVFCRHPSGIILSLYRDGEAHERAQAAKEGRPNMSAPTPLKSLTLSGARTDPRYHAQSNVIIGMAGRTIVPADFWEAWKRQNASSALLSENIVFAEANEQRGAARLEEVGHERTGWEGLPQSHFAQDKKVSADVDAMAQRRG